MAMQWPWDERVAVWPTEHFVLQSKRSATIGEANGRAAIYLSTVSSALVAFGFLAQLSSRAPPPAAAPPPPAAAPPPPAAAPPGLRPEVSWSRCAPPRPRRRGRRRTGSAHPPPSSAAYRAWSALATSDQLVEVEQGHAQRLARPRGRGRR
jgi:hypothetical protein